MDLNLKNLLLLFSPEIPAGNAGRQESSIELLMDDDTEEVLDLSEKKEEKKEEVKEEEKEEDEEEKNKEDEGESEGEIELEGAEEEEEVELTEELELAPDVTRKDILKKYPTLFKDFPSLERAMFKEKEFYKHFESLDEARESISKARALDAFEADLQKGSTGQEKILKLVKENNAEAFNRVVDDYLITLGKVDRDAYHHVLGNVTKMTIMSMLQEAEGMDNEDDKKELERAAALLNKHVFNTYKFTKPTRLSKGETAEETDLSGKKPISERERAFIERTFNTARNNVVSRTNDILERTIKKHIDPKESMTDYIRKVAIRDSIELTKSQIAKDARFQKIIDGLWHKAAQNDFDEASLSKIESAYLNRAKTVLPSVIKKVRGDALKGLGKKVRAREEVTEDENETQENDSRSKRESTRERTPSNKVQKGKVPDNMSTLDYLLND